jgi:hypothetical protein
MFEGESLANFTMYFIRPLEGIPGDDFVCGFPRIAN